jgi:hypothetical protein
MKNNVVVDGKWTTHDEWTDSVELPLRALNGTILGYLRMKYGNQSLYLLADIFSKPYLQGNGCSSNSTIVDIAWILLDPTRVANLSLSSNQFAFTITGDFQKNGDPCYHNVWRGRTNGWASIGSWHFSSPWLGSFERIDSLQSSYDPYSLQTHLVIEALITWPIPSVPATNPFGFMFYFYSSRNPAFPQISWPSHGTSTVPASWGDLIVPSTETTIFTPYLVALIIAVAIIIAIAGTYLTMRTRLRQKESRPNANVV